MKNLIFAFIFSLAMMSCGGGSDSGAAKAPAAAPAAEQKMQGKEYASKYICPMHCKGSGAEAQGLCPVCGMDYVANENWKDPHEGHNHDGHNH